MRDESNKHKKRGKCLSFCDPFGIQNLNVFQLIIPFYLVLIKIKFIMEKMVVSFIVLHKMDLGFVMELELFIIIF